MIRKIDLLGISWALLLNSILSERAIYPSIALTIFKIAFWTIECVGKLISLPSLSLAFKFSGASRALYSKGLICLIPVFFPSSSLASQSMATRLLTGTTKRVHITPFQPPCPLSITGSSLRLLCLVLNPFTDLHRPTSLMYSDCILPPGLWDLQVCCFWLATVPAKTQGWLCLFCSRYPEAVEQLTAKH